MSSLASDLPFFRSLFVCSVSNVTEIEEKSIVLKEKITPDAIKNASVSSVAQQYAANTACFIKPRTFIPKVTIVTITVDFSIDLLPLILK